LARSKITGRYNNRLLEVLDAAALAAVVPHLVPIAFERRHQLEIPNRSVEHVYFMEHGIASVVARGDADSETEVGIVGYEGVTGIAVILNGGRSPNSTYIQVSGSGQSMPVSALRAAIEAHDSLRTLLLRYVQSFLIQMAQTTVANARASTDERLSRWLLMAHDRIEGDDLIITHEFLALMAGTRRSGVTEAMVRLAKAGLVRPGRGIVAILDRKGLEQSAGRFYGISEAELDRLLG
jgi:CRP-like cAMP-binding protein